MIHVWRHVRSVFLTQLRNDHIQFHVVGVVFFFALTLFPLAFFPRTFLILLFTNRVRMFKCTSMRAYVCEFVSIFSRCFTWFSHPKIIITINNWNGFSKLSKYTSIERKPLFVRSFGGSKIERLARLAEIWRVVKEQTNEMSIDITVCQWI